QNSFSSLTQALIDVGPRLNLLTAQLQQTATKEKLDVERQRINNLLAFPETIDNVETADVRVDKDGIIHETAGDSVRYQTELLDKEKLGIADRQSVFNNSGWIKIDGGVSSDSTNTWFYSDQ